MDDDVAYLHSSARERLLEPPAAEFRAPSRPGSMPPGRCLGSGIARARRSCFDGSMPDPGSQQLRSPRALLELEPAARSIELRWDGLLELEPAEDSWLRRMPGRQTFLHRLQPGGREVVVKRFSPEGRLATLREDWRGRLRGRAEGPGTAGPERPRSPRLRGPARRERDALRELERQGLRVPAPLALVEEPGPGGRSLLVMEHVPHRLTLRDLELPPDGRLEQALLGLVLGLHRAGWYHRDLYLHHLVLDERGVSPEGSLTLLDCGRARRSLLERPRRRWLEKDLAALALWLPDGLDSRRRLRFLAGYLDGLGIRSRARRRAIAAGIEQRRLRMERHTPRFGEGPA